MHVPMDSSYKYTITIIIILLFGVEQKKEEEKTQNISAAIHTYLIWAEWLNIFHIYK